MRVLSYCLILGLFAICPSLVRAQLVDETPAPLPHLPSVYKFDPWENPAIDGINRLPAQATAYSFTNLQDALTGDREKSGRMMSLNGLWDFLYSPTPADTPKGFYLNRV